MNTIEQIAKNLEAEYHRNWRSKNKEKVKAINKRYWLKKAEKELKERSENNGYINC